MIKRSTIAKVLIVRKDGNDDLKVWTFVCKREGSKVKVQLDPDCNKVESTKE